MKYQVFGALVCLALLGSALAEEGSGFSVFGDRVYVDQKGRLSARNIVTGAILWDILVPAPGNSLDYGPLEVNGVLVICGGGSAQRVIALNSETGKLLWNEDGFCRAIASNAGKIFILHRPDGSISCLDVRTGKRLWENEGNGPAGKILILKNRVISDKIMIEENTGRTIRKYHFVGSLLGTSKDNLFWRKGSEVLVCTAMDGRELWHATMPLQHLVQFEGGTDGEYAAAYDDYPFAGKSGVLLKLNRQGHELWRMNLRTEFPLPLSAFGQSDEQLYVVLPLDSQHSIVREFSKETGHEEWASHALDGIVGPVVEAQGKLLVGERDGKILVLSKVTGTTELF
jgi:outer membrane protein assembly factor BamB